MNRAIDCEIPYYQGSHFLVIQRRILVAKQNYSFEKRQKEIAKKKKKEEKRLKKAGVDDNQLEDTQTISGNDDK